MEDSQGRGPLAVSRMSALRRVLWVAVLTCLPGPLLHAQAVDSQLKTAAAALINGAPDRTLDKAQQALTAEPRSRLAHWLQAQSLLVMAGNSIQVRPEDRDLLEEARVRLDVAPAGMLPKNLLVMPRSSEERVPVLLADAERSRIYVFASRRGQPVLIDEFYTSIGALGFDKSSEGDKKTPLGVYQIRYEIREPRKDGFLGDMAMTLDYPNAYDRLKGRTGSGIWIHGVPASLHVRPPKASDGCFAVANSDLKKLRRYVRYQESQIVVVPKVEWITPQAWIEQSNRVTRQLGIDASTKDAVGVFYVSDDWPMVKSRQGTNSMRRQYWSVPVTGTPAMLLEEKLS